MTTDLPLANSWQVCPRCGQPPQEQGADPFRCSGCSYQHHFGPVTAVGAVIRDQQERILLVVRAKDPGKGLYGLPGGFVDAGETLETALDREVEEEVGLKVYRREYLCSFPNEYHFRGVIISVTDMFFVAHVESLDAIRTEDGEIADYHFCVPSERELDRMAFRSNRLALELYLRRNA